MTEKSDQGGFRIGKPVKAGSELSADAKGRRSFAACVTEMLGRVSSEAGIVIPIEGEWGSGESSLLAMVGDLLGIGKDDPRWV